MAVKKTARRRHARKIGTVGSRRTGTGKKGKIRKPAIGIVLAETHREGVRVVRVPKKRVTRTKRSSVAKRRSIRARRAR